MQRRFNALRRFVPRHIVSPQFAVRLFGAGVVAVLAGTFAFSQGALARNSDVYALGDDFYKSIHERNFALRSEPNEITSSQQLRDMIYNRFGSAVLEQTTGSMRRYGQQFFGDGFRMRSNIGWDVTEGFRGDLELGVPLLPKSLAGHNFALQFQPGLILWTGHREQERLDINLGLVARYRVGRDSPFAFGMPSLIYGANIFYDINTDNSLDRLGVGVDMQARRLMLAVNAYIALDDDWQDGDDGYQERAVSGFEFRAHYDFLTNAQLRASIGGWENTDVNATGSDFDDYSFGATVGGDWYFHPNFAVSGDYEYESYGLGDSRFTIGLEARWPGKRLGRNRGTRAMDLYALVEREQRILYAERRTSVVVTAGMIGQSDIVETDGATNADVEFTLELSRALAAAGAAAGGNTAEFDVYTSVAEDDIGAGNTAAGASDYVAIGDPQASGEQTSPAAPVAAADTCAAATPGDATNPCRLRIVPGTTEGTLTITGLVLGDDLEEEAEYFAVKFKPTAATRARFGLPADFATAVVRILPSDPTRTIEMTFQETVALAPATSGGTSRLPVRVTLSKPLAAPVTIDVVLTAQVVVTTQQGPAGQQVRTVQTTRTVERTCRIPVTLESGEEVLVKTVDVSQCFATNQFDITEGEFADATVTLELPPKKLPPRDDDDDEGEEDRESAGEVFDLDGDNKVNGVPLAKEGDAGAGEKQKLKPTGAKVAQAKVALARPAANKRRVAIAVQYADGETSFAEPNSDGTENFRLTLSGTGAVPTGTRVRYEIVHIDTVAADVSVARARTAASAAGATFIALPVTIKADDLAEDAEAFGIKVTQITEGGSGETIDQTLFTGGSAPGYTATALIAANDRRMVSLASTTLAATETDADIEVDLTARLSGTLGDDLVLSLTAAPGTAVAGDYTVPTSLTIDAGDTSSAAKITIKGDELAEGTETFTIAVRYPSRLPDGLDTAATPNGLIGTVTVTITDDDQPAKLVLYEQVGATAGDTDDRRLGDTASVAEAGNAGNNGKKLYYRLETGADDIATASAALSIALASGSVSVTAPVTVATEPAHFAITPKALTIAQGASISTVFTLTTVNDNGSGADTGPNKNDRRFGLTPSVSDAPGWLATPTASTITITDDDGKARIEVQAGKAINSGTAQEATLDLGEVAEGDTLTLSFKLTKAAEGTNVDGISFALAVTDTNSDLGDLSAASVTLTNADNAGPSGTAKEVTLEVTDDALAEGDETFTIAVSSIAATGSTPTLTNFGSGTSTGTASITFTVPANDLATLTFSIASALAEPATTAGETAVNMRMESSARLGADIAFASQGAELSTPVSASGDDLNSSTATGSFDGAGANNGRTNIGAVTVRADNLAEGDETFVFQTRLGALIPTNTLGAAFTSANAAGKVEILLKRLGLASANTHLYKVGSAAASAADVTLSSQTSGRNTFLFAEITMTIPANDTIAKVGLFDKNPRGTGVQAPLTELTLEEAADATDLWVALLDADNKLVRASANVSVAVTSTTVTGGTGEGQLTIATSPVSIPAAAGKAKFTVAAAADSPGNEVDGTATLTATAGTIPAAQRITTVAAASVSITVNDKEGKPRITLSAASSVNANQIVSGGTATIGTAEHTITVKEGVGTLTLTLGLSKAFRSGDNITSVTVTPGSLEDDSEISEDDFENDGITSTAVTLKGDATDTGTLVYKIKNDDIAEDTETAKFDLTITKAGAGTLTTSNFGTPTTGIELNIIVQANDGAKLTFALPAALAEGSDATPTVTSDKVIDTNVSPDSGRSPIIFGDTGIRLKATTPTATAADVVGADASDRDVGRKAAIPNAVLAGTSGTRTVSLRGLTIEDDTLAEGAETFIYRVWLATRPQGDYPNVASLMQYVGLDTDTSQHKFTIADNTQAGALTFVRDDSFSRDAVLWAEITMTIPKNDTISSLGLFTAEPRGTDAQTPLTALTLEEAADATDLWVALLDADNKLVRSSRIVSADMSATRVRGGTREGQLTITPPIVEIPVAAGKVKFTIAAAADGVTSNEDDGRATLSANYVGLPGALQNRETASGLVDNAELSITVNDKQGKPRITIEAAAGGGAGTLVSGGTKTGITGNTNSGTDSADYELTVTEGAGAITLTFGLSKLFGDDADIDGITIAPGAIRTATQLSTAAADTAVAADFASSSGIPTAAATVDNTAGDTATLIYTVEDDAVIEADEVAVFPLTITKKSGSGGTLTATNFATPETINLKITILANDSSQLRFGFLDTAAGALAGGYVLNGETAVKSPELTIRSRAGAAAPRPRAMPTTVSVVEGTAEKGAAKDYTFTPTNSGVVSFQATGLGLSISSNTFSRNPITIVEDTEAEGAETFTIRVQIGDTATSGVTLSNTATLTNTAQALRTARVAQHLAYYGFTGPIQESRDDTNYSAVGTGGSKLLVAGGQLIYERTITIPKNDTIAKVLLFNSDPGAAGDTVTDLTDTLTVEEGADSDVWVAMLDSSNKIVTSTQNVEIGVALSGFTTSGREGAVTLTGVTAGKATITSGNASATFKVAAAADGSTSNEADNSGTLTASVSTTLTAGTAVASVPDDTMAVQVNDKQAKPRITLSAVSSVGTNQIVSGGTATIGTAKHSITVKEGAGTLTLTLGLSRAFRARDNITSVTVTPGSLETDSTMSTGDFETSGIESDAVTLKGDASDTGTLEYKIKNDALAEDTETAKFDLVITKAGAGTLGAGNFGTPTTVELNIIVQANDLAALTFSIANALAEPANAAAQGAENVRVESSAAFGTAIAFASLDVFASTPVSATVTGTGDDVNGSGATGTFDGTGANNGRTNIGSVTVLADNLAEADETFIFRVRLGESIVTSTLGRAFISANAQERTAILLTRLGLADFNSHFYKAGSAQKSGLGLVFASQSRTVNSVNRTSLVASITMTIPANDAIAKVGLFDANPSGTAAQTPLTTLTLEEAASAKDLWVALLDADNKLVRSSENVTVTIPTPTVTGATRGEGQLTIATSPLRIPAAAGKAKFTIAAAADRPGNEVDGTATLTAAAGAIPAAERITTVGAASVNITVEDKQAKPRLTMMAVAGGGTNQIVSGGAKASISKATHSITVKEGAGTLTLTLGLSRPFRASNNITSVTVTPGSLEDDSEISEDDFENDGITSTAVTLKGDASDTKTLVYKIKDDDIAEDTETAKFDLTITKAGAGTLSAGNFGTPTTVELNIIVQANDGAKLTFALPAALAEGSDATPTLTSDNVIKTNASPSSARSPIVYGASIALKATTPPASAADVTGADATDRDVGIKTAISNATFADTSGNRSLNLAVLVVEDDTLAEGAETFLYRVPVGVPLRAADYANAASLMQYNGLDTDTTQHKFEIGGAAQAGALEFKRVVSGSNVQLWAEITMTIPANDTIAKLLLFNSDPGSAGDTVTDLTDTLTVEEAADSDVWVALLDADNKIVTLAQNFEIGVVLEKDFTTTGNEGAVTLTGVTADKVILMSGAASATFKVAAAADTGAGNEADNSGTLQALASAAGLPDGAATGLVISDTMAVTVNDKQGKRRLRMQAGATRGADIVSGGADTEIKGNTSSATDSVDYALSVTEGVGAITFTFTLPKAFSDSQDIGGLTITPNAIKTATQLSTAAADTAVRADFATGTSGVPAAAAIANTDGATAMLVFTVNNDNVIEADELAVFPLAITKSSGDGTLTETNFAAPETINLKITILANDSAQLRFYLTDRDDNRLSAGYVLTGETAVKSPKLVVASTTAARPRDIPMTVSVAEGTAKAGPGKDYTFTPTSGGEITVPKRANVEVTISSTSRNVITILDDKVAENAETFTIRTQIGDTAASKVTLGNTAELTNTADGLNTAKVAQHLAWYGFKGPIRESYSTYTDIGASNSGSKLLVAGGQLIYERTITIPKNDPISGFALVASDATGTALPSVTLGEGTASTAKYKIAVKDASLLVAADTTVALALAQASGQDVFICSANTPLACTSPANKVTSVTIAAGARVSTEEFYLIAQQDTTAGDATLALNASTAATGSNFASSAKTATKIADIKVTDDDVATLSFGLVVAGTTIDLTVDAATKVVTTAANVPIAEGQTATLTASLSGARTAALDLVAEGAAGTASAPLRAATLTTDFTVSDFDPIGTSDTSKTSTITVVNDTTIESAEVFTVTVKCPATVPSGFSKPCAAGSNGAVAVTINFVIAPSDTDRLEFRFGGRTLRTGPDRNYVLGFEAPIYSPTLTAIMQFGGTGDRPAAIPYTVSVMEGTAKAGSGKDYTFSATSGGLVTVPVSDAGSLITSSVNAVTVRDDNVAENAETFTIRVQIGDTAASGVTLTNTATLTNTVAALRTARVDQHLAWYGLVGPIEESPGSSRTNIGLENSGSKLLVAGGQLIYERTITIPANDPISGFALVASSATGTALPSVTLDEGTASTAKYKIAVKDASLLVAADTTVALALARAMGQDVFICSANTPLACTSPANKVTSVTIAANARVSTQEFYLLPQQDTTAGDATLELKASTAATDSNFASSAKTAAKIADIKVTDDEVFYNVEVRIPATISVSGSAETKTLPVKSYDSVDELAVTVKESSGAAANMAVKIIGFTAPNPPDPRASVRWLTIATAKSGDANKCGPGLTTTASADDATVPNDLGFLDLGATGTSTNTRNISIKPETSPPDTGDEVFYFCPIWIVDSSIRRVGGSKGDFSGSTAQHFRLKVTIQDR